MNKTKIPYLDYAWQITTGCSKISSGCQNCYSYSMSKRLVGMGIKGYTKDFKPTFCPWLLDEPSKIKKPSVIGISYMGDLFHKDITDDQIDDVLGHSIDPHTYIFCTKRPERMRQSLSKWSDVDNCWFGCTIENNDVLEDRLYHMTKIKELYGFNTFLSIEPLLEDISVKLEALLSVSRGNIPDGIIVGGESGIGARYCNPQWIAHIYQICQKNDIKFYFKQYGTNKENLLGLRSYEIIVPGINRELIPLKQVENTKELSWWYAKNI